MLFLLGGFIGFLAAIGIIVLGLRAVERNMFK